MYSIPIYKYIYAYTYSSVVILYAYNVIIHTDYITTTSMFGSCVFGYLTVFVENVVGLSSLQLKE